MGRFHNGRLLPLALIAISIFAPWASGQTWISAVSSSTTATGATITWITAVPADSQVKYSVTDLVRESHVAEHEQGHRTHNTITGLPAATAYHPRVMSRDASGILVTSYDNTFTTKAAPVSVSVSPQTASVVRWNSAVRGNRSEQQQPVSVLVDHRRNNQHSRSIHSTRGHG
jgi:hypothetical protein